MKNILAVALCLGLAACSTQATKPELPTVYVPKHPELSLPDPVYNKVTLKESKALAAIVEGALSGPDAQKEHPDLAVFVGLAGTLYINAHRAQITDCSDKKGWKAGPGMAMPECVWQRPNADDWMGCMAAQFSGEAVFQKFHLSSMKPDETMYIWIDRNYDTIVADPQGQGFLIKLNGMAQLGAQCDALTADEPPEGSIAV